MSNKRQLEIFRKALSRATAILAQDGVKVTQIGVDAFCQWDPTTGKLTRINIPMVPAEPSAEFMAAIQGYVDHEVAHARFTQPLSINAALKGAKNPQLRKLADAIGNVIEDARIEKAMEAQFEGSVINLDHLRRTMIERWSEQAKTLTGPDLMSILAVPYLRGLSGQPDCARFSAEAKAGDVFKPLTDAMPDLATRLSKVRDTLGAYSLGLEIAKILLDPPQDDSNGSDKSEDPQEGQSDQQQGEDQNDQQDKRNGDREDQGENQTEGGDEDDQQPGQGGDMSSPMPELDPKTLKDAANAMSEVIADLSREAAVDGEMLHLTFDYDRAAPPRQASAETTNALAASVSASVSVMAKHLERLLVARKRSLMVGGFNSGRISAPSLHRAAQGATDLFRRRIETKSQNVAITLLVDNSSSMNGDKMKCATKAAFALATTLHRLKISFEVAGFTVGSGNAPGFDYNVDAKWNELSGEALKMAAALKVPRQTIRAHPVSVPIYKGFAEPFASPQQRRIAINADGRCSFAGGTDDPTAIRIAGERLLQRPEPRKIMIVLSDGQPAITGVDGYVARKALSKEVSRLASNGVEVFGIGIMTDSVRSFYPDYAVLNNASDLPALVMDKLAAFLLKK